MPSDQEQLAAALLELERRERVRRAERDLEFFKHTYFRHYMVGVTGDPIGDAPFHRVMMEDLQAAVNRRHARIAYAAPRDHAKSVHVALIYTLWCALFNKEPYIIYISDSYPQAKQGLENIKAELEENDLIKADFGNMQGELWTKDAIILKNDVKIEALGSGMKLRGRRHRQHRPSLIICDDVENDQDALSPDARARMEQWFFKAVSKAGNQKSNLIVIGTILHYESLLSHLLQNPGYLRRRWKAVIKDSDHPELWQEWRRIYMNAANPNARQDAEAFYQAHRDLMDAGVKVLWPEKVTYRDIQEIRLIEGEEAYNSELQNDPVNPDTKQFRNIHTYQELPGPVRQTVMAIDPSMGKSARSDPSAIVVLGRCDDNRIYTLEADIRRRHPDVIVADALRYIEKYQPQAVIIEVNQFQELFKEQFEKAARDAGIKIQVKPERHQRDKTLRIQSLQPDIDAGNILIHQSHHVLLDQLEKWPFTNDDGVDALEMARGGFTQRPAILDYYAEKLKRQRQQMGWEVS